MHFGGLEYKVISERPAMLYQRRVLWLPDCVKEATI